MRNVSDSRKLSVHALSEFIFCRRAFTIAIESPFDDQGRDISAQRLDFVPSYQLEILWSQFVQAALALFLTVCSAVGGIWFLVARQQHTVAVVVPILIYVFAKNILVTAVRELGTVSRRILIAQTSRAKEPDLTNPYHERIGWWELRAAGFAVRPRESFADNDLRLAGAPWRMLVRGRQVVPVFLRVSNEPDKVRLQHEVRMHAYVHLMREANLDVPYALILDARTESCWVIKITDSMTHVMLERVKAAHQFRDGPVKRNARIDAPRNLNLCRGCPWSRPETELPEKPYTTASGEQVQPQWYTLGDSQFRTRCGDRFNWLPPREPLQS